MATKKELELALTRADAAGDEEAATAFATALAGGDYTDEPVAEAAPEAPAAVDTAGDWLGSLNYALAPYATAAGLGAAAGAPIGGVGAIPGAAGGILSLGLGDIGTSLYNLGAQAFGGQTVQTPSQSIREAYLQAGLARRPKTAGQRIAAETVSGVAGGIAGPSALATTASRMGPPLTQRVMQTMAEAPRAQAAAGGGATFAPAVAQEMGVEDPLALTGLSLAGGMAAGGLSKPTQIPTSAQLKKQSQDAYRAAEQAGIEFDVGEFETFTTSLRQSLRKSGFSPKLSPKVEAAITEFEDTIKSGDPVTFETMEILRRIANTARNSKSKDERRLAGMLIDKFDDFVEAGDPARILTGNIDEGASAIRTARDSWRRMSQADLIDNAVERATNSAGGLTPASLRSQFRAIVNNEARLRRFDPEVQKLMRDFVRGKGGLETLQKLGNLAPGLRSLGGRLATLGLGGAAYGADPTMAALLAGTGLSAKAGASRLAKSQVERMSRQARAGKGAPFRTDVKPQTLTQTAIASFMMQAPPGERLVDVGYNKDGTMYPIYGR